MPAKNCHFADWLAEVEPILLNKSVTKKLDRDTIFILLAFCFGWQSQDEPCEQLGGISCAAITSLSTKAPTELRRVKTDMLRACKNEYIRRGSPLHHTAWNLGSRESLQSVPPLRVD